MKKLDLVIEAVQDWKKGVLSGNGAMMAISLIVFPQPPLTQANIDLANKLAEEDKVKKFVKEDKAKK
jgi:hypothetical protein